MSRPRPRRGPPISDEPSGCRLAPESERPDRLPRLRRHGAREGDHLRQRGVGLIFDLVGRLVGVVAHDPTVSVSDAEPTDRALTALPASPVSKAAY